MAYTPVRISTVKPNRLLTFKLFIFFKEQYLTYAENGSQIEEEKYSKLKKQKVAKFYIDESDEMNYQKFLDELLNDTMNSSTATTQEKTDVVEGACGTALERMQDDPGSESAYKMTENAAKNLRKLITDNPDTVKQIFGKKASKDDEIIKHSLNVSALATKLGQSMDLSEEELDNIAVAGLIHDIGITKLEDDKKALFNKPRRSMSADEKSKFSAHIKNSIDMLQDKPYVNEAILGLVNNHQETLSGSGPNKKSKLSVSESIISVVNTYDLLGITNGLTPKEAIKELTISELGNYDLDLITKLKNVIKTEGLLEENLGKDEE